jgi:hypothetical protein
MSFRVKPHQAPPVPKARVGIIHVNRISAEESLPAAPIELLAPLGSSDGADLRVERWQPLFGARRQVCRRESSRPIPTNLVKHRAPV